MEPSNDVVLELEGLSRRYQPRGSLFRGKEKEIVALNQVSLRIGRGEIFGLVGESGSGKTTAGRLIVKLEEPNEGRILLDGREVVALRGSKLRDFRRRVQMIFQDPYQSLNPHMSVFDTICEPLTIHDLADADGAGERVRATMKDVGLSPPEDFVHRYPHQLSGGQRQRVAIARAMVLSPDFVVADEPTSMLDASISAQIFNILLKMRDKHRLTILFITHSLAAARYLCDRIAVIYRGNLMEVGPAEEIIHNPKHPYTRALIDALPKFGHAGEMPRYDTLRSTERDFWDEVGCRFFPRCAVAHPVRCGQESPPLEAVGPAHRAACFYAGSGFEEAGAG